MSTKVLVLDAHADVYRRRLLAEFPALQIVAAESVAELPPDLSDIDALIGFGIELEDDFFSRAAGLKWVQCLATGVDHLLRRPALKKEVVLTSGRGIHGAPMRETVIYLMLGVSRDVRRLAEDQKAHRWERRLWNLLHGKTAVVAGVGVVGIAIGQLLKAFEMHVIGLSRTPRAIEGFDDVMPTDRLREAAHRADYLINVLPATAENAKLFDAAIFSAMQPTAYFINAGRGQTVDEAALIAALRERRIAGAGLDVFQTEPLPPDSPLWDLPNVFIAPHLGGYIAEYQELIMPLIIDNMRLFLAGRRSEMHNVVAR
jgi:phosphoglycerate dehydrogenase-like enzyme